MEELYDITKEVHSATLPLRIHTIYWILVGIIFGTFIIGHQLDIFGRFEILWLLTTCFLLTAISYYIITSSMMKPVYAIAKLYQSQHNNLHNIQQISKHKQMGQWAFYFSPLRHVTRFWQLYTELPVRYLIEAQKILNNASAQEAEVRIYHRLGAWMHVIYSDLRFSTKLSTLRSSGWIISAIVVLFLLLTEANSGFAVWYGLMSLLLFNQARATRLLYHHMVYAELITISVGDLVEQKITAEKIHIYEPLKSKAHVTIFDKPTVGLHSIKEVVSAHTHNANETAENQQKETQHDKSLSARIDYVKKHLAEGYPEHILKQALVSAGTDSQTAEKIILQAKQQG